VDGEGFDQQDADIDRSDARDVQSISLLPQNLIQIV
jgi:hypothetical protein